MRTEKERFQEIANVIAGNVHGIERIFLDEFEFEGIDYSYLVVSFKSGAFSVRNCKYNSLTANIREVAAMLNGGYYREVESYTKLRLKIRDKERIGERTIRSTRRYLARINSQQEIGRWLLNERLEYLFGTDEELEAKTQKK